MGTTRRASDAAAPPGMPRCHGSRERPCPQPAGPPVMILSLEPQAGRPEVDELCQSARDAISNSSPGRRSGLVICDVGRIMSPDAGVVDALCRLQLECRRAGGVLQVRHASHALRELLQLTGLDGVVPLEERLRLEPRRQPEHREEARGVQEEHDPGDPTA
jgi:ABC-type transporter Mla MlaB component